MTSSNYYLIVGIKGEVVAIELDDHSDDHGTDVWQDVEEFVARVGSDLIWVLIDKGTVLDCARCLASVPYGIDAVIRTASDVEYVLGQEA